MKYLITGISLPYTASDSEIIDCAKKQMNRAASAALFHFSIHKKSVDARKKNDIRTVCSVVAECEEPLLGAALSRLERAGIRRLDVAPVIPEKGNEKLSARPLVVGAGPAGMFCALLLAENGYNPVIIDRGGSVSQRLESQGRLRNDGVLDKETNILKPFVSLMGATFAYLIALKESATTERPAIPNAIKRST